MVRILSFLILLVVIVLAFAFLTRFLPKVLKNRAEHKKLRIAQDHEEQLKKEAFQRSYDLLTMLTYDPRVASLVYQGLTQHLEQGKLEEASDEELDEFEEYEKQFLKR